jgi:tetratricopeptide (TPR) repeat protein
MRHFAPTFIAASLIIGVSLPAHAFDAGNTDRIQTLVETGMRYYWSGGDVKKAEAEVFKGITLHGRYDVVEQSFAEAAKLAPERIDFLFGVASSQILQKNIEGAASTYNRILEKDPQSFDAQASLEALARMRRNDAAATLAHQALQSMDRDRADDYRRRFLVAEEVIKAKPNVEVPKDLSGKVMVVALGYALAKDGTAEKPLLDRLEVALKAAQAYPSALVMVTGGQPQAGVTEGDVMMRWLVDKGISRDRIMIEDKSKDTVGNMLNVANLLNRHSADQIVLVTSSSHMRRAEVLLRDALHQNGNPAEITPVVALDAPSVEEAAKVSDDERMVIYRDLIRISGIWAYPGLQQ